MNRSTASARFARMGAWSFDRRRAPVQRAAPWQAGFTLLELTVSLVLLALISALLFGSLSFAGRTWDGGEAKVAQISEMRQTEEFLRAQITSEFPLRGRKIVEFPLQFAGEREEMRYAAALPARVAESGIYYFRLALARNGDKSQLVLERVIPDPEATSEPEFHDAERSVLADGISEIRIEYFGRDPGATDADTPTWRDHWDDKHRLPMMIRINVTPEKGPPWPQLVVQPRQAPEAGCRAWDVNRNRCVGV